MRISELCEDERPMEKLIGKGAESLSNSELLALLLKTGTGKENAVDLARKLLLSAGGTLTGLSSNSLETMTEIPGIGRMKAATIAAAFEIGRRFASERCKLTKESVTSPRMIYNLMHPVMMGLDHEELWLVFLNRANYVLDKEQLTVGGMNSTILDTKMIVRKCLEKKACGLILVHNHPSGNPHPSREDLRQTEALKKALRQVDISLVDHIVMADDSYFSFSGNEVSELERRDE